MSDDALIAAGAGNIFRARQQCLVVGLTGRTGSGCSTVAKLLQTPEFAQLTLPDQHNPVRHHEDRKYRVLTHWIQARWRAFLCISVSDVIAAFAMEQGAGAFRAYLRSAHDISNLGDEVQWNAFADAAAKHAHTACTVAAAEVEDMRRAYAFYYGELRQRAAALKNALGKNYSTIFQALGDNLRKSGNPFVSLPDSKALFTIPIRLQALISLGRRHNLECGVEQDYFVVDALRHPYEILYLRENLHRFYAVAVTTDSDSRKSRLTAALNYGKKEIDALDAKEYPGEQKPALAGYDKFTSQDIQACINACDIHLSNPGAWAPTPDTRGLAATVCKYVALMQHPGLVMPTPEERCMQSAYAARLNSGCISRQVGAVVTDARMMVKGIGWNDAARGQVPCALRYSRDAYRRTGDTAAFSRYELQDDSFREELRRDRLVSRGVEQLDGRHVTYCFRSVYNAMREDKNQVHTRALHAEENAFLQIAKAGGQGIEGGCLFTTSSPCELCAKKAYQLGLRKIFYIDPYPGIAADHVLGVGDAPPILELFTGVIGSAYHDLYAPIMPYKDELKILLVAPGERQAELPLPSSDS